MAVPVRKLRFTPPFRIVLRWKAYTGSRVLCDRPANDVRIDCKAAKHSDGDRGAVLAHLEAELRKPRRQPSVDCSSAAIAARANKRRFVNLLQQLGARLRFANYRFSDPFGCRFGRFLTDELKLADDRWDISGIDII